MSLNYVTLTFSIADAGQDAASGAVTVAPTSVVTASGVTVVSQQPVVRQVSGGAASVMLVACDNSGTSPAAGFWAYEITLPGQGAPGTYLVNFANGSTQRFDSLSPAIASTTYGPAASGGATLPLTTLGDILYEDATPKAARLPGNTTTRVQVLSQVGNGSISAAPTWADPRGLEPCQFYVPRLGGGSDDGANITTAIANAIAYALAHQAYAEVVLTDATGAYLANTAPTVGGSFAGAAIIPVMPQSVTALKPVIKLKGLPGGANSAGHWLQQVPQAAGTVIATTRTDGVLDTTNGPYCVIGGPFNGYGAASGNFSNIELIVDGITIQVPYPSTYSGMVLRGLARAFIPDYSFMPAAVTPSGTSYPQFVNGGPSADQWTVGLWMPDSGNNMRSSIGQCTVYGAQVGLIASEHCAVKEFRSVFNGAGLLPLNKGTTMCHGIEIEYFGCEETSVPIQCLTSGFYGSNGPMGVEITQMDLETYTLPAVQDGGGLLTGWAWFGDNSTMTRYYSTALVSSGSPFKLQSYNAAPGWVGSPQAPPSSGSPWLNGYYRDAEITLSVSGGTLTGLLTDSGAESLPASCTLYKFDVPSGHTYTPTLAGGAPVLSHKVKLL